MSNKRIASSAALVLCAAIASSPLATQAAVGHTVGTGAVSTTGGASYSIPITVPPGTNGMTPAFSLNYNSGVGNGLLGVGWSIGGLSAITRCPRTWAQDGGPRDVRRDYTDRFCLDGNKLRLTGGTYGNPSATYQTEVETFSRITSFGAAGNGPASFTVEGKDGSIYEYGNTTDSRIEVLGFPEARTWALSKIRDRVGNAITFTYFEDPVNGSYRITSAQYTSNSTQALAAAYSVEFVYETRPTSEIDSGYIAGGVVKEITRLDRVDVKYNSTVVRRYELTYEGALSSTSKSRLASIQECAGSPLDCFPATTFSYQNGTSGIGTTEVNTGLAITQPWAIDVNGDGRDDLVYATASTWMVALATTSGGYGSAINTGISSTTYLFADATPIDYNADGMEDILVPGPGGTWYVMLGSASGLATPSNTSAPVTTTGKGYNARTFDVDGDGLDDLVWADLVGFGNATQTDAIRYRLRVWGGAFGSTVNTLYQAGSSDEAIGQGSQAIFEPKGQFGRRRQPDFNGDGRDDVILRYTVRIFNEGTGQYRYSKTYVVICPGACAFSGSGATSTPSTSPSFEAPYFGDFNGDGKSDILYTQNASPFLLMVRLSKGNDFTGEISPGINLATYDNSRVITDWDGDGYDDILVRNITTGELDVYRSTGESFAAVIHTGIITSNFNRTISDINGDGLPDIGSTTAVSGGSWTYRLHPGSYPDLMQTATDAYGNFITFNYAPLTTANYQRYADATYPEQDYQGPMYVVNSYSASNGTGGTYTNTLAYYGARLNLQGRGLEGFYAKRSQDSRNSLYVYDYFNRLFPYTGALFQTDVYQSNGSTFISRQQNAWTNYSYGSGFEARTLPYVNQSTAYRYEFGGTYNGTLLSTAVTTNVVDSGTGTLYDSTRTTTEASGANGFLAGAQHVQRLYHSTLFTDTANWCLGRPQVTQAINSHTMNGGASLTRTSNTSWDGPTCRPTQSVIESGNALWQVTTDYGYDGFGNVNAVTVTPAAGQGQVARSSSMNWGTSGQFPLTVTNAKSQVTTLGWDFAKGVRTSVTDPNSLQTTWTYDGFGRLSREQRPDGTATDYVIGVCNAGNSYCGLATDIRSSVQVIARDTGNAAIRTDSMYFDAFDRTRYNYQQLQSGAVSGSIVSYDPLGRVATQSTPFLPTDSIWYTTVAYDALNRPTQVYRQTSESDVSLSTTVIDYQGLRTVTTDPLSHANTRVYNTIGQVVQAFDAAGSDTDYEYNAFGDLLKTRDVAGNEITLTYNVRGMKMTSSDPDLGSWSYNYFPLGELKSQTDAKSQNTTFTYDELSRPLTRVEPDATTTWTWDTSATKGIGKLASVAYGANYTETYTYDTVGRPSQTSIAADGVTYLYDYAYQATTGLLDTLTYPASISGERFKVRNAYTYGYLTSVQSYINNVVGTTYWTSQGTNARNQTVLAQFGNGVTVSSGYDRIAGWLDDRVSGLSGGSAVQNLAYEWNKVGSLTKRRDLNQGTLNEQFYYDSLDRLDYSTLNGVTNLDLAYNAIGNITSKSDVGTYTYGSATHKHAVTSTTGTVNSTFGYDANGNMTTRNGQTVTWTSANYPLQIFTAASTWTDFRYTHDRRVRQQAIHTSGNVETWWYIGGLFEKRVQGTNIEYRHFIVGADGPIAVRMRNNGGASTYYLTQDHLGSTNAVTGSAGTTLVNESYDAFGQRRGSNWTGVPSAADNTQINASTKHGFTFHEHLTNSGLIQMQGRVFDPVVGRFMSADPYVDGAYNSQGYNRYSYVGNNPLSRTDPTGFQKASPRTRARQNGDEISSDQEFAMMRGNLAFYSMYGNGYGSDGTPSMQGMTGMQWANRTVLNGFRGANGQQIQLQGFAGTARWVPSSSVGVGAVGPNGEAVDSAPATRQGFWEVGSGIGSSGVLLVQAVEVLPMFSRIGPAVDPLVRPAPRTPIAQGIQQALRGQSPPPDSGPGPVANPRPSPGADMLRRLESVNKDLSPETRVPEALPRLPEIGEQLNLPETRWGKTLRFFNDVLKVLEHFSGTSSYSPPITAPLNRPTVTPATFWEECSKSINGCA